MQPRRWRPELSDSACPLGRGLVTEIKYRDGFEGLATKGSCVVHLIPTEPCAVSLWVWGGWLCGA